MQNYLSDLIITINNLVGLFIAVRFYNHYLMKRCMRHNVRRLGLVGVLVTTIFANIIFKQLSISLLVGFVFFFLVSNLFYLGKIHIKLIAAIFLMIFSFITELLTALLFVIVFGEELQNVRDNLMHLFLGSIVSKIFVMILVEVIIRFRRRNASKVSLGSWILIVSIPIVTIILAVTNVYDPIIKNEFNIVSVISCLSILYINIIVFYLFDNIVLQVDENNRYQYREKQMLMQQEQYVNVIEGYNQVRQVRHDILSHLITLDGYLADNQYHKATEYIRRLNEELSFSKRGIISSNVVIDALVNNRKSRALYANIKFEEEIIVPSKLKINDMDLCIVLGNALNNAIESCLRLVDKQVEKRIVLKIKYKHKCLFIELRNSYDLSKIKKRNGKFVSSKAYRDRDELGTGIGNMEMITKKYGGVCQTDLLDTVFVTKIMLPDKDIG